MCRRTAVRVLLLAALVSATLAPAALRAEEATPAATPALPTQPTQPATGPGGADYAYDEVVSRSYGETPPNYWIFEPAGTGPETPQSGEPVPLVIFITGCCEDNGVAARPDYFRSWIDHIVRKGAVVVYPIYTGMRAAAVPELLDAALAELATSGHTAVNLTRVTVIGASAGGTSAFNLVASPPAWLPAPTALMLIAPDCCPEEDVAPIPPTTYAVLVAGEHDGIIPTSFLEHYWAALAGVPAEQRAYVTIRTDLHGSPRLWADHVLSATDSPTAGRPFTVNALDWYGTWKFLDGLMACAFTGEWCEYAFGNTPEQRYMGTWSDGVPVNEAIVAGDPGTPEVTPTR